MKPTLPENLYDYESASKLLGVTDRTLRNWVRDGRVRAIRMGPRTVRFDPDDLKQFLDRAKSPLATDTSN